MGESAVCGILGSEEETQIELGNKEDSKLQVEQPKLLNYVKQLEHT